MKKKASAEPVFQKTAAGTQLTKVLLIQDLKEMNTIVQVMKLDPKTQKTLGASIKSRSQQLDKLRSIGSENN